MNQDLIQKICQKLNLGAPISPVERIYGGLLHKMWKLTTDQNSYAIKELASHIDFKNQSIRNNYELSEKIATMFANDGIPAINAIHQDNDYLIEIDGKFFLIYPWVNAKTLLPHEPISDQHGIKIAELISKIHQINLNIFSLPPSQEPEFNSLSSEKILETIKNSQTKKAPFSHELKKHQKILLALNQKYLDSIPHLKKQSVISHGDLDSKNVLWDAEDQPVLIDWESARRLNPTHEIINACLDWSGITLENNFNQNLFFKMLEAYQKSGGVLDQSLLEPAFYAVAGNWAHWMVFNIQRFCETQDPEILNLSAEQVSQTLRTILLLEKIIPTLLSEIKKQEIQEVIQWGLNYLSSHGYALKNKRPELVQNTPWSYVVRFTSAEGIIYLKHTPQLLALEAAITQLLHDQFHASVPEVLAHNAELHCFLMKDAGRPLREILRQQFDVALLCKAIEQFTSLQLVVAEHIDVFLNLGVPDWRLDQLPNLYQQLISQKELLIADGLSELEISMLETLRPTVSHLCQKLSEYPIKQTMVQCDFHDNNILIDTPSQKLTFIDLGEIVISHPFFSLIGFLRQVKFHHSLSDNEAVTLRLMDACLEKYLFFESKKSLLDAFEIANVLWFIYEVLAQYRLMIACDPVEFMTFQRHGKLSGRLKEFMAAFNPL